MGVVVGTEVVVVVGLIEVVDVVGCTVVVGMVVGTEVVVVVGGIEVVVVVGTVVGTGVVMKFAVIVIFAFIVTVHSPVPLHPPPDQPLKVDPGAADAERDTTVPAL